MSTSVPRRLITLAISPSCEKARWALEHAGLDYEERRFSLGLHKAASRRAGGTGTVPVLVAGDRTLADSDAIVAYADRHLAPHERLRASDEAVALGRDLDAGLGEDARRWLWGELIDRPATVQRHWSAGLPAWQQRLQPVVLRLARRSVIRELELTPELRAARAERIQRTFDEIAGRLADGRPFLLGERFTAADLSFATMASPVIAPEHYTVPVPGPEALSEASGRLVATLRDHPAGRFALGLFAARASPRDAGQTMHRGGAPSVPEARPSGYSPREQAGQGAVPRRA